MTNVEAKALALALEAGAVDCWDLQAWADDRIAEEGESHPLLLEFSPRLSSADALSLLHELSVEGHKAAVARLACGHLRRALEGGTLSDDAAAAALYRMVREDYIPEGANSGVMWSLADDFELVACGEYTPEMREALSKELHEFLDEYAV